MDIPVFVRASLPTETLPVKLIILAVPKLKNSDSLAVSGTIDQKVMTESQYRVVVF